MIIAVILLVVVIVAVGVPNVVMRKKGYSVPGTTVVRCSQGHLFKTLWVEGGSLKAVRLGPVLRYQRCPRCQKFRLVRPVKDSDLTDEERSEANGA